jgi:hypothetical protein
MITHSELLEQVERIKMMLVSRATGGRADDREYRQLRTDLINITSLKPKLPAFLKTCSNLDEFWGYIKEKSDTYQGRRDAIRDGFLPALSWLEDGGGTPADEAVTAALTKVDSEHVRNAWEKALGRRESDPDGAITSARSLIESVCKHILDMSGTGYEDSFDLPKLYSTAAKQLQLSPAQHNEDVFKQILSGCQSVVNGLAALRNSLSDAHGKGKAGVKPAARHAELAVNLAGSMATFLVATSEARSRVAGKRCDV